jgi:hypothetical protein
MPVTATGLTIKRHCSMAMIANAEGNTVQVVGGSITQQSPAEVSMALQPGRESIKLSNLYSTLPLVCTTNVDSYIVTETGIFVDSCDRRILPKDGSPWVRTFGRRTNRQGFVRQTDLPPSDIKDKVVRRWVATPTSFGGTWTGLAAGYSSNRPLPIYPDAYSPPLWVWRVNSASTIIPCFMWDDVPSVLRYAAGLRLRVIAKISSGTPTLRYHAANALTGIDTTVAMSAVTTEFTEQTAVIAAIPTRWLAANRDFVAASQNAFAGVGISVSAGEAYVSYVELEELLA